MSKFVWMLESALEKFTLLVDGKLVTATEVKEDRTFTFSFMDGSKVTFDRDGLHASTLHDMEKSVLLVRDASGRMHQMHVLKGASGDFDCDVRGILWDFE